MTRDCGGRLRLDEIPLSNKRPRLRRHDWPPESHQRRQADIHSRTFWGRFVYQDEKLDRSPAWQKYPCLSS